MRLTKRFLAALALILFAAPSFAQPVAAPPRELPRAADLLANSDPSASTVFVHMAVGNGKGWAGTGTVVACEGGKSLVLTNAHVVPHGANPITVRHGNDTYPATFVAAGSRHGRGYEPDLCLLVVDAEMPAVEIADSPPRIGERLRQWAFGGQRFGAGPTFKVGVVADPVRPDGSRLVGGDVESSLPTQSGDSGSGVFNDAGELVGVTWAAGPGYEENGRWVGTDPQRQHSAVPLAKVRAFVKTHAAKLFPRLAVRLASRKADKGDEAPAAKPKDSPKAEPKKPTPKVEAPKAAPPAAPVYRYEYAGRDWRGRDVWKLVPCEGNR